MGVLEQTTESISLYGSMLCVDCKGKRARIACYLLGGASLCVECAEARVEAEKKRRKDRNWERFGAMVAATFSLYEFYKLQEVCYVWKTNADMASHLFTTGQIVGEVWAVAWFLMGALMVVSAVL